MKITSVFAVILAAIAVLCLPAPAGALPGESLYLPALSSNVPGRPLAVHSIRVCSRDTITETIADVNHSHVTPLIIYPWDTWPLYEASDALVVDGARYVRTSSRSGLAAADVQQLSLWSDSNAFALHYVPGSGTTVIYYTTEE